MSWFRRVAPEPPPVEAYRGGSAADLAGWLRRRAPYLDGHADRGWREKAHLLSLCSASAVPGPPHTSPEGWPFVQVSGGPGGLNLQASGDRGFGGDTDVPPDGDARLLAAGWRHPGPDDDWPFYLAEVADPQADAERVVVLVMAAVREVLGIDDGWVRIDDAPYDARRDTRGGATPGVEERR